MTSGVESIGTDKKLTTILIKLKNSEQSYTRKKYSLSISILASHMV